MLQYEMKYAARRKHRRHVQSRYEAHPCTACGDALDALRGAMDCESNACRRSDDARCGINLTVELAYIYIYIYIYNFSEINNLFKGRNKIYRKKFAINYLIVFV